MKKEVEKLQQAYEKKISEIKASESDTDKLLEKIKAASDEFTAEVQNLTQEFSKKLRVDAVKKHVPPQKPSSQNHPKTLADNQPVTFISAYVLPYYSGPQKEGAPPERVSVAKDYDHLLASTQKKNILEARDAISKNNENITPMTLFVLSARLYDVGEKDEAAFWFYVAKDRYAQTDAIVDKKSLASILEACHSFSFLMGPFINGSIFCDIDKQVQTLNRAARWSETHPYKALLHGNIASPHSDRKKILDTVIADRLKQARENSEHFSKKENREEFKLARQKSGADKRFCN